MSHRYGGLVVAGATLAVGALAVFASAPAGARARSSTCGAASTARGSKFELRAADGSPLSERVVESGKIEPRSIRVDRQERSVLYRKDGREIRAALRG